MTRPPRVASILALLVLLAGCSRLGIGARVHDLGDGRYKIATSQALDVEKDNAAAAQSQCPGGYTILDRGVSAESLYGSMILGADLATWWIVRCDGAGK